MMYDLRKVDYVDEKADVGCVM